MNTLVSTSPVFHEPFKLACIALEPCPHLAASSPASAPHVVTAPYNCVAVLASKLASSDQPTAALTTDHASEEATAASDHNGLISPLDVGTLTDVCCCDDIAEVDLIQLIEEQIPRYVLRADTLTDFAGYQNEDWIHTPCLPPEVDVDLSPELVGETLKYFTICADRVCQMTKTYNDIEAVTRLLEEKERDLELAARIGQNLLEKNQDIESQKERLEELLVEANEKIAQLRHELSMKDALLQIYLQDCDTESSDSPTLEYNGFTVNVGAIHKKVQVLEEENLQLKVERAELECDTVTLEEKEQSLTDDCVRQLSQASRQVSELQDELCAKAEVMMKQQDDIKNLMAKVIALENQLKKMEIGNAELQKHLAASQRSQKDLTMEISDLEDRCQECVALLHVAQEEVRVLRKKHKPTVIRQNYTTISPFLPEGSLAMELEDSLRRDAPEYNSPQEQRRKHVRGVMETVKYVRQSSSRSSVDSRCSSVYYSDGESDADSVCGNNNNHRLGRPGVPGSNDLETALRRLTLRKANEINERILQSVDESPARCDNDRSDSTTPCVTPESAMSVTSDISDMSRISPLSSSTSFRMPEKLQIVKPIEGSVMLHQWQRLATPHMANLLEMRPGVQVKGGDKAELEEDEVYNLNDYEEDDEYSMYVGKCVNQTSSTYTFTTSKILHPSHEYYHTTTPSTSSSYMNGRCNVSSNGCNSRPAVIRPQHLSLSTEDSHGTSTYSMSLSLATRLHERDTSLPQHHQFTARPPRFESLTSETMCSSSSSSHASTIYTSAQTQPTSTVVSARNGSTGNAYLNLAEKIKDIGLNNILSIAQKSGVASNAQDPVDIGLNTIMNIRRNRGRSSRVISQVSANGDPYLSLLSKPPICTVIARENVATFGDRPRRVHMNKTMTELPTKGDGNVPGGIQTVTAPVSHSSFQGKVPELVITQCTESTDASACVVTHDMSCHLSPNVKSFNSPSDTVSERASASILKKLASLNLISSRPRCATSVLKCSSLPKCRDQP